MKRPRTKPRFEDCTGCRFYHRHLKNPLCGSCGAGEFFEQRINTSPPTDEELMNEYRSTYHE